MNAEWYSVIKSLTIFFQICHIACQCHPYIHIESTNSLMNVPGSDFVVIAYHGA